MRNKKGMLLAEETLKTVLAVIAIGILISFLVSLYFGNLKEAKQKAADATLERISEIIESSNEFGEVNAITPEGWFLFSFAGQVNPNSCAGNSCTCICKQKIDIIFNLPLTFEQRQAEECSDDGKCLIVKNLGAFEKIEIKDVEDSPTSIKVSKVDEKIIIEEIA